MTAAIVNTLRTPRAAKGARNVTPMQKAIRNLDRVWGRDLVDAMLRVAQAIAVGEKEVAEARIAEIAGHPRGAKKRTTAVRAGAQYLLEAARRVAA